MDRPGPALPVSILLPTRNSARHLSSHIKSLRELLPLAREVVVVDSESTDGTTRIIERERVHPSLRILSHPPGLYESWNHGVNACRQKYVYLSTVGDSMSRRGLEKLVGAAESFACDLVVSPPELVDEKGRSVVKRWPVYDFVERLELSRPVVLNETLTLLLALVYMRKAILGSSASNLYRTETLRRFPFPTDFGHAGDVGWGLRHAGKVRFGILPEVHSTFLFHQRSAPKKRVADISRKRIETARSSVANAGVVAPEARALMERLCDAWEELFETTERVEMRRRNPLRIVTPGAWKERSARSRAGARLAECQEEAFRWIRESLALNAPDSTG